MPADDEPTRLEAAAPEGAGAGHLPGTSPSAPPAKAATAGSTRAPKVARIGRYPVTGVLGRGGIGEVLQVYDPDLGRAIAVKILRDSRDPVMRRAFAFEARVLGHLQHPHIVPVHELGTDDEGRPYFTMLRIDGRTLHDRLAELARTPRIDATDELLDAFTKLCSAVAYAHDRGVLHLDLKPANVMLGRYGQVQLVDWGLARLADPHACDLEDLAGLRESGLDVGADEAGDVWMPGSHRVMGTPAYMPPEQAFGPRAELDRRADVYALGAILYHILCRLPPYLGEDAATLFAQLGAGPPTPPRRRAPDPIARYIPAALEAICLRAMARDPAKRYATVDELRRDLDDYRHDTPSAVAAAPRSSRGASRILARRAAVLVAALLALILVAEVIRARRAEAVALAMIGLQGAVPPDPGLLPPPPPDPHTGAPADPAVPSEAMPPDAAPEALDALARLARDHGMTYEAALYAAGRPGEVPLSPVIVLEHVEPAPTSTPEGGAPPDASAQVPVYLATGAARRAVARGRVLDVTGEDLARSIVFDAPIVGLAMSGDERTLAVLHTDLLVAIALPAGIVTGSWPLDEPARAHAISHDGRSIALAFEATLGIADARSGQLTSRPGAPTRITALAYADDDATLAAGTDDGTVALLDAVTGQLVSTVTRVSSAIDSLVFGRLAESSSSSHAPADAPTALLVAAGRQLQIWDPNAPRLVGAFATPSPSTAVAYASQERIAAVGRDGTLRMWRTASGEPELSLGGTHLHFGALGVQGRGRIVTADGASSVRTWRLLPDRPAPRVLSTAQLERISGLERRGCALVPLTPTAFARHRDAVPLTDLAPRE